MNDKSVAFIGGDSRHLKAAAFTADMGLAVRVYTGGFSADEESGIKICSGLKEAVKSSDAVILPMPLSDDGITVFSPVCPKSITVNEVFSLSGRKIPVFAGRISGDLFEKADRHGVNLTDYYKDEALAVKNAHTTAEAAISIAIKNHAKALFDCSVLVTGYGRIAKALAGKLRFLAKCTTVCARKETDRVNAVMSGTCAISFEALGERPREYDVIFNTVPETVLNGEILKLQKRDALIIDLASKPGGTDFEAAAEYGINTIHALALPAKFSPDTAAGHIAQTIYKLLEEQI